LAAAVPPLITLPGVLLLDGWPMAFSSKFPKAVGL
jgi:hypothetical protein